MSRCWNCRKRRLKCDGGIPGCQKCWGHGVICLGYQKPLTWVEGVARRGPMKNRNFGDTKQHLLFGKRAVEGTKSVTSALVRGSVPMTTIVGVHPVLLQVPDTNLPSDSQRVCPTLVLNDGQDNPYRRVITCIGSPAIASALVTIAACHYIQSLVGCPLAGLALPAKANSLAQLNAASSGVFREAPFNYYLRSKGQCLKLISARLAQDHYIQEGRATLTAVVLLTILDIFESGSGAWSLHLEGAKKLLSAGIMGGSSEWDSSARTLLHEAAIFQTFGSSLAKPGALTSGSTLPATWTTGCATVTPIGCPISILSAVEVFASQRRFDSIFSAPMTNMQSLQNALHLIRSCEIPAWAESMTISSSAAPYEDLVHLGTIWKLAADIYACCVLHSSTENATFAFQSPPVHALITEYSFFERKDDDVIKCLIWPTFVAGGASTSPEERAWVLKTLDRIWNIGHCANTRNAAEVLQALWEKHDHAESLADEGAGWHWITELSRLKGSWLFV